MVHFMRMRIQSDGLHVRQCEQQYLIQLCDVQQDAANVLAA
jgi:hypothetical protein